MLALVENPRFARLRQLATGGAASIAVSVAATNMLRIISTITLTRLLDSSAYGVVGIITSVSTMIALLTDVGMMQFIARHPEADERRFQNEIWTIRLGRAAFMTIAMLVFAEPIAKFVSKPELAAVLAVWSFALALDGLSSLAFAMGVRRRQFWRLSMMDFAASVVTFGVSLGCALATRSYWSLIAGMLTGATFKAVLSYVMFDRTVYRPVFSRERSRELWGYSRFILPASILQLFILQSDKVILARLMPLSAYGLYAVAVTLAAAPGGLAGPYSGRVLYGVYSHAARNGLAELQATFYPARRKVVLLYMFAVSIMAGAAPLMIGILYDERYRGVAPYLQLLTISTVLMLPTMAAKEALFALGKPKPTLVSNIFRIIWLGIGAFAGLATHKIMLLVAIVGTVELPGMLINWVYLRKYGLLKLREELYGFIAALAGGALGAIVSATALHLFPALG
jgi:O-antigen/teichoic acid export membrane protein